MKKLISFCLLLLISATMSAQQFVVKVNVEGLPDGTIVEITPLSHNEADNPVATATVKDGAFTFTGDYTEPLCVYLRVQGTYGSQPFMLENGEMAIDAKVTKGESRNGIDSYNWNIDVKNSPLTEKMEKLMTVRLKANERYMQNRQRFQHVLDKDRSLSAEERKVYRQSDEFKAMEAGDHEFFQYVDSLYTSTVLSEKDSFWAPLILMRLNNYFTPEQRKVYNQFSDAAKNSVYGKMMREELWPAGAAGDKIPSFTIKDDAGKSFTFEQLAAGKTYVLLDFWASWCAPCRKEIPNIKAQYQRYKSKGFEVIGISIDRDAAAWKKALAEEQLQWPNFLSTEVANQFKVKAVPTVYLVSADGTIIAENMEARGEALQKKLAELLGE